MFNSLRIVTFHTTTEEEQTKEARVTPGQGQQFLSNNKGSKPEQTPMLQARDVICKRKGHTEQNCWRLKNVQQRRNVQIIFPEINATEAL